MIERVKKTIEDYAMLSKGDRVVVGVSGGADSIALLYILHSLNELELDITAAHLNHGLRGEEADRDASFVEKTASSLGIGFEQKRVETLSYKEEKKLSLEDAARELRYEFFDEVYGTLGADKIATAHTQNDQAETVLMRLLRGSGLKGLSGISPVSRGYLVRPLLFTNRSEIEEYLSSRGIEWVDDSSNESDVFLRNRIRRELIPLLKSYNPKVTQTLARTAEVLQSDYEFVSEETDRVFEIIFQEFSNGELLGDLNTYRVEIKSLRLSSLRKSIETISDSLDGVSYDHIVSADEFLLSDAPSGTIDLPGDTVIEKGYEKFIVTKKHNLCREFSYLIETSGKHSFPDFEVIIEEIESKALSSEDESTAQFSAGSIEFPIEVRSVKPGDRFMPLGMKSFKKVQDYFTDVKLPKFMRNRVPIFLCKGEIFWIGGMRIDERAKVQKKGDKAYRFRLSLKNLG